MTMRHYIPLLSLIFVLAVSAGASPADATPCLRGTFSGDGQQPCDVARAGTYVDQEGQTGALFAPTGYFAAQSGQILPSPVPGGFFSDRLGQSTATGCIPGTASRAGAVQCAPVDNGVPQALGPAFNSNFGPGGPIGFGRLDVTDGITAQRDITIVLRNDANDFGLTGGLSSDLTINSFAFRGANADLFSLGGFVPNTVIGEGESIALTLSIGSFNQFDVGFQSIYSAELTFRTDQGNAFGFDPASFGFDPIAVEQSYAFFRENPPQSQQLLPLSQEFAFSITATVPEPSSLALLLVGLTGLGALRRGKTA